MALLHKYLVACQVGGVMEDPVVRGVDKFIIFANDKKAAEIAYNKQFKCEYYYGSCIASIVNGKLKVYDKNQTTVLDIEELKKAKQRW